MLQICLYRPLFVEKPTFNTMEFSDRHIPLSENFHDYYQLLLSMSPTSLSTILEV